MLDGSNRSVLINSDIEWPAGITVDHANARIYWTDTKKRTVETVTVDGYDRQTVWKFGPGGYSQTCVIRPMKELCNSGLIGQMV